MIFDRISEEEFNRNDDRRVRLTKYSEIRTAVEELGVGEAIKFPCRWEHKFNQNGKRGNYCLTGKQYIYNVRKDLRRILTGYDPVDFHSYCKDGNFYVKRTA